MAHGPWAMGQGKRGAELEYPMNGGVRPELRGPRVLLRAPRASDRDDRLAAGRDPEFRRMVGGTGPDPGPLTMAEVDRWYAGVAGRTYSRGNGKGGGGVR